MSNQVKKIEKEMKLLDDEFDLAEIIEEDE